jgi:hypothetical protein
VEADIDLMLYERLSSNNHTLERLKSHLRTTYRLNLHAGGGGDGSSSSSSSSEYSAMIDIHLDLESLKRSGRSANKTECLYNIDSSSAAGVIYTNDSSVVGLLISRSCCILHSFIILVVVFFLTN